MTGKKEFLAKALQRTGILPVLPYLPEFRGEQLRILTYHRIFDVSDESQFPYDPALISASVSEFRAQMEYLASHFFPVTLADVLAALDGGKPLPRRAVVITLDDGHADTYTNAFPVFRSVGIPAAVFLATGYVGAGGVFWFDEVSHLIFRTTQTQLDLPGVRQRLSLADVSARRKTTEIVLNHLKSLPDPQRRECIDWLSNILRTDARSELAGLSGVLTWDQVREMARAGIEFGSHSVSHPILTQLDDSVLQRELCTSRAEIEKQIGGVVNVLAYPEGGPTAFDTRVMNAARQAGYRLALSYIPGVNSLSRLNRFALKRLQIERTTSRQRFRAMLELPGVFALEMGDDISSRTISPHDAQTNVDSPPLATVPFPRVDTEDDFGWHVLLGDNLTGRVLCVDLLPSTPSDFFRALGGEVYSIDISAAGAFAATGNKLEDLCRALESDWVGRGSDCSIDAFVLHDLDGLILNAGYEEWLLRLLKTVNQILKPDGMCYLGFRNAHSLFGENGISSGEVRMLNPAMLRAMLGRAGFPPLLTEMHPYLLTQRRVLEILPDRGYTSVKNSRLWREHFKEICYGRFGAKRWAPAYGVVAAKAALRPSRIAQLAAKLDPLGQRQMTEALPMKMMRCQLLWRKVILSYGSGKGTYGSVVVVYTADTQAIARRVAEAEVLVQLAKRVPTLSDKLPRVIANGNLDGHRYFALSEIAGMTIDRQCPGTMLATRNAANFLSVLHLATAQQFGGFEANGQDPIDNLFEQATNRYPSLAIEFARLAAAVRLRATEEVRLTVWQHGDFKLENVVLDPRSLAVVGVIDWELSQQRGLPLLDLLYLFAYNRSVNCSQRVSDVYLEIILPWKFSPDETPIINDYQKTLGFSISDFTLWAALYLIHDVGVRFSYDLAVPELRRRLEQLLDATYAALQTHAGRTTSSPQAIRTLGGTV